MQETTAALDVFEKARTDERLALANLARQHDLMPYYRVVESAAGPVVPMEGRDRVMMGSNNYLGLTLDPRIKEAAQNALDHFGTALTGARLQNGTVPLHLELEHEVAEWMGTADALVFTTGYLANLGALSALLGPRDTVIVDSANHASLVDGVKLSGARIRPYRHGRVDKLEGLIARARRDEMPAMVVVDGVFSMEGTIADLGAVAEACRAGGVRLFVDEAHAVGVLGPRGAGASELYGVEDSVDLRMGTFSKSLASCGGFIAGDADVIDYLRIGARAFLFTVSAVPAAIAAALAAIRICRSDEGPQLFGRVLENAAYLHNGLQQIGWKTVEHQPLPDGSPGMTPIVPVRVGDEAQCGLLWKALWDEGLYANLAVYPGVPPGEGLLRLSAMATHEREHLDRALDIFERLRPQFPEIPGVER